MDGSWAVMRDVLQWVVLGRGSWAAGRDPEVVSSRITGG